MPVYKSNCELYRVSKNGEHATIVIQPWVNSASGRQQHGGELVVHGTFGTFGHTWTLTGQPFKEFLLGLSFSQLMKKCFGQKLNVYCPDATRQEFKEYLDKMVALKDITEAQAALVFRVFEVEFSSGAGDSHFAFGEAVERTSTDDEVEGALTADERENVFGEASYIRGTKINPQAQGFWDELWPEFVGALKAEFEVQGAAHAA